MHVPADALRLNLVADLPVGTIFFIAGNWFLRVQARKGAGQREAALALTGVGAGALVLANNNEALHVAQPYSWEAAIANVAASGQEGHENASLRIWTGGPCLWGAFGQGQEHCFSLAGLDLAGDCPAWNGPRYPVWSVWLTLEGKRVGSEPLFPVDRSPVR